MNAFLEALWQPAFGYGEIRAIKDGRVMQEFVPLDTPDAYELATESAAEWDAEGFDTYIGVLRRKNQGGKASDVTDLSPVLWADIDPYKGRDRPGYTAFSDRFALGEVLSFALPPSIIVDSGHGIHAYWLLDKAVPVADARQAMKGIALAIGGDNTHDPARVLRLPGTHNHKNGQEVPVRLLRLDLIKRYRFSDFSEYVEKASEGRGTPHGWHYGIEMSDSPSHRLAAFDNLPPWLDELIRNGVEKGQRSEACYKVAIWLLRYGYSDQEIYETFLHNYQGIGAKMHEKGIEGGRKWFDCTLAAARGQG